MNEPTVGPTVRRTDGQSDGRSDGRSDGQTTDGWSGASFDFSFFGKKR